MLRTLTIRDVVIIDRLEIAFHPSLGVLTGETGAGKSILLDALGLAIGHRADSSLVRPGASRSMVTAEFEAAAGHPAWELLKDHGIDSAGEDAGEGILLLRRVLSADGRSRAFVNDQAVSVGLLREIGDTLVEVHGQFESQRLLDPVTHGGLLDALGGLESMVGDVGDAHGAWKEATAARAGAEAELEAARRDEEFLRHAVDEMSAFDPQPGEEDALAARRTVMMHGEKLLEAMNQTMAELTGEPAVEDALRAALRHLGRMAGKAEGCLDEAVAALQRAALEVAEGVARIDKASRELDLDPRRLEEAEERLFALRALARKHNVGTDELAGFRDTMAARLAEIEDGGAEVERLRRQEKTARAAYVEAAGKLSRKRARAAERLDRAIAVELKPLKLGQAKFSTLIEEKDEAEWSDTGRDRVAFQVVTNPGMPAGPLGRISSGGELARFTLALKVVLAGADPVPTVVFDEVDSGVGGAVAAAVGERLARLGEDYQVLVVTHSPQVAARGAHHLRVAKSDSGSRALTTVETLSEGERREEIARMLSGARVTDEARAAAGRLLEGGRQ